MELKPISFSGGVKSISDDDLCATCRNCQYRPGEMSSCGKNWPGLEDEDGYVQECVELNRVAKAVRSLTDTGYPTGLSKLSPEFRGTHHAVLACGDNLDAPVALLRGDLFWGAMSREALPAISANR